MSRNPHEGPLRQPVTEGSHLEKEQQELVDKMMEFSGGDEPGCMPRQVAEVLVEFSADKAKEFIREQKHAYFVKGGPPSWHLVLQHVRRGQGGPQQFGHHLDGGVYSLPSEEYLKVSGEIYGDCENVLNIVADIKNGKFPEENMKNLEEILSDETDFQFIILKKYGLADSDSVAKLRAIADQYRIAADALGELEDSRKELERIKQELMIKDKVSRERLAEARKKGGEITLDLKSSIK